MASHNLSEGLLHLAVKRGLVGPNTAAALLPLRDGRSMAVVLVEKAGLTPEVVRQLRDEQKRNSIPGRIGPYRLTEHLGNGGMSIVYKGMDPQTRQTVAVKLLSPKVAAYGLSIPRFQREVRSASEIDHPNVIKCLDHGEINGHPYQILEYMAGGDVATRLQSVGRLSSHEAITIVRDCALGLAAIHAAGMVHRDVKPANIFLDAHGSAKVADLGLARHMEPEDQLTLPGHCVGTPWYMSPEQARGCEELDGRADLFSLGATLYHLLSGQPPFRGATPRAVITAVLTQEPPAISLLCPDLAPDLVQTIQRCLAKDRQRRFAHANEIAQVLGKILSPSAGSAVGTVTPLPRWSAVAWLTRRWSRVRGLFSARKQQHV